MSDPRRAGGRGAAGVGATRTVGDDDGTGEEQDVVQGSGAGRRPGAPRAPLPRRVYVVRRLIVVAVPLVLVAFVVWWFLGRSSSDETTPRAQTTATSTAKATTKATTKATDKGTKGNSASSSEDDDATSDDEVRSAAEEAASAAGVPVCVPDSLDVEFEATADAYSGGDKPAFRITVTNTGDEACLLEAGDANRRVAVSSGDDLVWSSSHCLPAEPASRPLLLGPGAPSDEVYTWPRVRSAKGCTSGGDAPRAGTYTAKLRLGGETVGKAVFDLR